MFWLVRVYPNGGRERVYGSCDLGDAYAAADYWKEERGFRIVDNSKAGLQ